MGVKLHPKENSMSRSLDMKDDNGIFLIILVNLPSLERRLSWPMPP